MSAASLLPPSQEIARLRERLEEAEDTLRAIRSGEADALVIGGDQYPEVFTLEGGTESYRAFMEAMEVGAAALDSQDRVLYANHVLCDLLGRTAEALQSDGLFAAFEGSALDAIRETLQRAHGQKQSIEIKRSGEDGDQHLLLTASPLLLGLSSGLAVTLTDITERVRTAAEEESERLARAVLASANQAVVVCDRDGIISHANAAAATLCDTPLLGMAFQEAIPLLFPDMTGLMRGGDLIAMAVAGTSVQAVEASAPGLKVKDLLVSAAPLMVAGESIRGCVVTIVDLTQRKAAERQQQLLMGELDHRVKNTLTLVLSICSRTATKAQDIGEFQKALIGRIQALAATHNLLAEKSWRDVTLEDLVTAELAPFGGTTGGQVTLVGFRVSVTARAATALGLVFHELATNAVKYGALSRAGGRLKVEAMPTDGEESLVILWEESGGPVVEPPTRRGFGHTVIARSLAYDPAGGTEIAFLPSGVRCTIRVPAVDVLPETNTGLRRKS